VTAPAIAVDASGGERDGWIYLVWEERVSGALEEVRSGHQSDLEPNDLPASATPIETGVPVSGVAIGREYKYNEEDYFRFQMEEGETVALEASLDGFSSHEPGIQESCYFLRLFGPPSPSAYQAYGMAQLNSSGMTAPSWLTASTSGPAHVVASGWSGRIDVHYRLIVRRLIPDPNSAARDHRDIVMVASPDGGRTWTPKVLVNDGPVGYDESHPMVTVDGNGTAHVAWYDRSVDQSGERGVGINYQVRTSSTADGGVTWTPSFGLSAVVDYREESPFTHLGDRFVFQAERDSIYGIWTEMVGGRMSLRGEVRPVRRLVEQMSAPLGLRVDGSARVSCELNGKWPDGTIGLWKRVPGDGWTLVDERSLAGAGSYGFVDHHAPAKGSEFEYRVLLTPDDSFREWGQPVRSLLEPETGVSGPALVLMANPVREQVAVRLVPLSGGPMRVGIYDVAGRRLREWRFERVSKDGQLLVWDRRDQAGRPVAAGRYFVRAEADGQSSAVAVTIVD
jgi:hypothetical protein